MPGAETASCERRIFFFDLDVFFFGTAIDFLLTAGRSWPTMLMNQAYTWSLFWLIGRIEFQTSKSCKSVIERFFLTMTGISIQITPTFRAESPAIFVAER